AHPLLGTRRGDLGYQLRLVVDRLGLIPRVIWRLRWRAVLIDVPQRPGRRLDRLREYVLGFAAYCLPRGRHGHSYRVRREIHAPCRHPEGEIRDSGAHADIEGE